MRHSVAIGAALLLVLGGCSSRKKSSKGGTKKVAKTKKTRKAGSSSRSKTPVDASGLMTHFMRDGAVNVAYTADDAGSGLDSVEIWISKDGGKKWEKLAVDKQLTGKVPFEAKDEGIFDFTSVGVDKIGNREKELSETTRADFRIVVDRTPPKVSATAPAAGTLAPAGAIFTYSWKAEDIYLPDRPVELQIRFKKNPAWITVARDLAASGKQKFNLPAAQDDIAEVRFVARDSAGNVGSKVAGTVAFDRLPPVGKILSPRTATDLIAKVKYTISDPGAAKLTSVSLWITENNGRSWRKLTDAPNQSGEVEVRLPRPGAYGLALSASDAVGNRLLPPVRGTRPNFTLSTDTVAPKLEVSSWVRRGQVVSARKGVQIKWKAEDVNAAAKPVSIEFSSDGGRTWTTVQATATPAGTYVWKPSGKVNSKRCLLRIVARDQLGNESKKTSRSFTVDNIPPKTKSKLEPLAPKQAEPEKTKAPGKKKSGRSKRKSRRAK